MMKRKSTLLVLLVVALFLLTACSPGNNKNTSGVGSIKGFIREATENGALVTQEVTITVAGKTVTVEDGSYEMDGIPAGRHTLKADSHGYEAYTADVVVKGGEATVTDIILQESLIRVLNKDLDVMNQALTLKDLDMLMSAHTADVVYEIVMQDHTEIMGYDDVRAMWEQTLSDPYFFEYYDPNEPYLYVAEENIVSATSETVVVKFDDGMAEDILTLVKDDGRWKIKKYTTRFY